MEKGRVPTVLSSRAWHDRKEVSHQIHKVPPPCRGKVAAAAAAYEMKKEEEKSTDSSKKKRPTHDAKTCAVSDDASIRVMRDAQLVIIQRSTWSARINSCSPLVFLKKSFKAQ